MNGSTWFALRDAIESEDPDQKDEGPDPRETPFFAVYYKFANTAGEGQGGATWFDVAHVEGTPEAK